MKPLFVPLKTVFFNRFALGLKEDEVRLYGARWNTNTCTLMRAVTLSKGYGKKFRLTGRITKVTVCKGMDAPEQYHEGIKLCYGDLSKLVIVIGIQLGQTDENRRVQKMVYDAEQERGGSGV